MSKSIFGLPWSKVTRGVSRLRTVVDARAWLAMLSAENERMTRLWQAWKDIFLPAVPEELPFEEPASHLRAREILGKNFHGVLAAQKCFGPYTAEELEQHIPLRLYDVNGNPFTNSDEETLAVCAECMNTHILVALKSLSLLDIHTRAKTCMANDQNAPWFGEQRQCDLWSSQAIRGTWLLLRKEVVPDSWNKSQQAQQENVKLMLPKERLALPAEYVYSALLHQQETGMKLCGGYWVRFPVRAADGGWVDAFWNGGQLYVSSLRGEAYDGLAPCSVRAS